MTDVLAPPVAVAGPAPSGAAAALPARGWARVTGRAGVPAGPGRFTHAPAGRHGAGGGGDVLDASHPPAGPDVVAATEARPRAATEGFEEFAAARGAALVRLARGLLKDPHHAEDVVQEVLAKALLSWDRVQRADDPDAYVRRMVVNASTSFWRRAVRRERPVEQHHLPDAGVADSAQGTADRDQLLALLRRLPTKQRTVLVLRHYEGLPDAEIAELLGTSAVTVRSNAHRGLAALRDMLAEEGVRR
ncbi:SigE family RNA polymerase sigma factor [Thalassiella azotivora]